MLAGVIRIRDARALGRIGPCRSRVASADNRVGVTPCSDAGARSA
jgi:hypothetical protein